MKERPDSRASHEKLVGGFLKTCSEIRSIKQQISRELFISGGDAVDYESVGQESKCTFGKDIDQLDDNAEKLLHRIRKISSYMTNTNKNILMQAQLFEMRSRLLAAASSIRNFKQEYTFTGSRRLDHIKRRIVALQNRSKKTHKTILELQEQMKIACGEVDSTEQLQALLDEETELYKDVFMKLILLRTSLEDLEADLTRDVAEGDDSSNLSISGFVVPTISPDSRNYGDSKFGIDSTLQRLNLDEGGRERSRYDHVPHIPVPPSSFQQQRFLWRNVKGQLVRARRPVYSLNIFLAHKDDPENSAANDEFLSTAQSKKSAVQRLLALKGSPPITRETIRTIHSLCDGQGIFVDHHEFSTTAAIEDTEKNRRNQSHLFKDYSSPLVAVAEIISSFKQQPIPASPPPVLKTHSIASRTTAFPIDRPSERMRVNKKDKIEDINQVPPVGILRSTSQMDLNAFSAHKENDVDIRATTDSVRVKEDVTYNHIVASKSNDSAQNNLAQSEVKTFGGNFETNDSSFGKKGAVTSMQSSLIFKSKQLSSTGLSSDKDTNKDVETSLFGNLSGSTSKAAVIVHNPAASNNANVSLETIRKQVHEIYQTHNPAKISEIAQLMEKYKGRELQLIANLEKKYGKEVDPGSAIAKNNTSSEGFNTTINSTSAEPSKVSTLFGSQQLQTKSVLSSVTNSTPAVQKSDMSKSFNGSKDGSLFAPAAGLNSSDIKATGSLFGAPNAGTIDKSPVPSFGATSSLKHPMQNLFGQSPTVNSSLFGGSKAMQLNTGGATITTQGATPFSDAGSTKVGAEQPLKSIFGNANAQPASVGMNGAPDTMKTSSLFSKTNSTGSEVILQQVRAIYSKHNPAKLSEVPQLMEKYRGRELQLLANLEKKYGGGVGMTSPSAASQSLFGAPTTASKSSLFGNSTSSNVMMNSAGGTASTSNSLGKGFGSPPTSLFGSSVASTSGATINATASNPSNIGANSGDGMRSLFGLNSNSNNGNTSVGFGASSSFGAAPASGFGAAPTFGTQSMWGSNR